MPAIRSSALELIGDTPLVALDRLYRGPGRLLAKAEFLQPGGSVKDRAARQIIEDAYASERLAAGQTVVEMTSGNMGAGLAVVCNALGNPFVAVMSSGNSLARVRMLEALGARVERVPQVDGVPGEVTGADVRAAAKRAEAMAVELDGYYVDQFYNESGVRAHETGTGPEILRATGGRLDAFVAAVGSGGTFVGTARAVKTVAPSVKCFAVEPAGCEPLAGHRVTKPRHRLQGTGYGVVPPHWDATLADGYFAVDDETSEVTRKRLAVEEGLHVGWSAAANVAASLALLREGQLGDEPVVATILCDTGLKY